MEQRLNERISPVISPKAYLLIVDKIVSMVASGELEYGEHLYTENDLMVTLNVSRPTLREALRVLEFLGILSVSPRKGICINRPEDSGYYRALIYTLVFDKTTNVEIFQIRRAIQMETVSTAADAATEEELAKLQEILWKMKENLSSDYMTFEQLDYDFHMQIVISAHNGLCIKLMQTMSSMVHKQMRERLSRMPMEERQRTVFYHSRICDALLQRNGAEARRLMEEHLGDAYSHIESHPVSFDLKEVLS